MKIRITYQLTLWSAFLILQASAFAGGNLYVKSTATGTGDGSSWTDAITDLQAAIDLASPGDTVRVAAGTYLPTHQLGQDTVRNRTFFINKSIYLYGGFSGDPGTEGNPTDRDPKVHETILSGDTGLPGDPSDNVFHVVYFDHVSDSTRLDGFVIRDGNSINGGGFDGTGTGIFNNADAGRSHPVIANCIVRNNYATESGGGMLNYAANDGDANPLLINCTFMENSSSGGGGISNYSDTEGEASPTLINCRLMGNTARTADGGAMNAIAHSSKVAPILVNCIISGNHSPTSAAFQAFVTGTAEAAPEFINCAFSGNTGGAIRISNIGSKDLELKIRNCIIFGNDGGTGINTNGTIIEASYSIIPFGFPGENIIGLDPLFVSQPPLDSAHTLGDLHVQDNSPAIDAGKNEEVPAGLSTDLDGQPRFVNPTDGQPGTVDIGPYEVQTITTATSTFYADTDWRISPNPANEVIEIQLATTGEEARIRLIDLRGNILSTQQFIPGQTSEKMDVSRLAPGNYYVHLLIDGKQDVKKVVVQ